MPDRIEGQRRQVTVLFTDIAGYTPIAARLGEEGTYLFIQRVIGQMSEAVHAQRGTVQELTGDGMMALFGAPSALEDAPLRACHAALDIQARMQDIGDDIERDHGVRPVVRIGMHSGPLVIGKVGDAEQMEFTALGNTVNLASRLESAAEPGSVLISDATYALVKPFVEANSVGELALKGIHEDQTAYRLIGLKQGTSRFEAVAQRGLAQFVGRSEEIKILIDVWNDSKRGVVRVVDVAGEAGIGKSRLIHEFKETVSSWDEDSLFLHGECTNYGRTTAFRPFIDVVRDAFRIPAGTGLGEIESQLQSGLSSLGTDENSDLDFLLNLLGHSRPNLKEFDAEIVGIRTRQALRNMLQAYCRGSPVVLFVEDLHWIDSASEQLLETFVENDDGFGLLIVCTHRPEYRPSWSDFGNVTELRLGPLQEQATKKLLAHRLGTEEFADGLSHLVDEKSGGNPLLLEEIVNYLIDRENVRLHDGKVDFVPIRELSNLPQNLENMLLERIDRLSDRARLVLEAASILGSAFDLDLLESVSGVDNVAGSELGELMGLDLFVRETSENRLRFKHSLVRDAIYNSLLTAARAALHEQTAVAIEQLRSDRLNEFLDELADNYAHTSRFDKAAHYAALAGEKSLTVYSLNEAELRFRKVIALAEETPASVDDTLFADVLMKLARVHYYQADFKSIVDLIGPYLERIETMGNGRNYSRLLFEIGYAHVFRAEGTTGKGFLEQALAVGEEIDDAESIGYACLGLMFFYLFWTEPVPDNRKRFSELGDRVMALAKRTNDTWLAAKCLNCLWGEAVFFSRFSDGEDLSHRLIEISRESRDPRPMAFAYWQLAFVNLFSDHFEEAIKNADRSLETALSPLDRFCARSAKAGAFALTGHAQEAFEILDEVRRAVVARRFFAMVLLSDVFYGASMGMAGELGAGVSWIRKSMRQFDTWGNRNFVALGHMILGEIYLQMALREQVPPLPVILKNIGFVIVNMPLAGIKARKHLNEAIRMSREFDMPGHLARSLYGLGRLYMAKNQEDRARVCFDEANELATSIRAENLVEKISGSRGAV